MFYRPYTIDPKSLYRAENQAQATSSYIRFFNAVPNSVPLDIYINGTKLIGNLSYKDITKYIPTVPGNYNIKIYPTGETTNPILDTKVYIPENTIFNIAIVGEPNNISLYTIPEPVEAPTFGRACIRFIHLSKNAPKVDVALQNGNKIFTNVGYQDITDYACIPAGTYSFNVLLSGTNTSVLSVPNLSLSPDTYYTIYAIGNPGQTPPLEAMLVKEPR
ncbi:MAG: DUF4397 domain-containing protein [Clostridium sp.]|nr:DUF4397 domain-containing protein [Clostridium sp.]